MSGLILGIVRDIREDPVRACHYHKLCSLSSAVGAVIRREGSLNDMTCNSLRRLGELWVMSCPWNRVNTFFFFKLRKDEKHKMKNRSHELCLMCYIIPAWDLYCGTVVFWLTVRSLVTSAYELNRSGTCHGSLGRSNRVTFCPKKESLSKKNSPLCSIHLLWN